MKKSKKIFEWKFLEIGQGPNLLELQNFQTGRKILCLIVLSFSGGPFKLLLPQNII